MLTLSNARVRRGPQVLIDEASVTIFRGEKVGVVGRNGCGKSTLLALIRGELSTDAGEYSAPPKLAIASVAQDLPDSPAALIEYILDGDLELRAVEAQLAEAQARHEGTREATLHAQYEALDGYSARSRAAQLAAGLGFAVTDLERPVREFSGGLRMRANLARTLMRRSELLLLDEPTNHLDLDALLWLEDWLRAYKGTLLLVSHDREFLDQVVGRILHFENGRLTAYTGSYSDFEVQHAAHAERTAALLAKQRREAAHIESFVARFRAQASKARQVQSRIKWLARLETIATVQPESDFDWEFMEPPKLPRPLVTLEKLSAGYGERRVLDTVSLGLHPGERLGILGRNGAGKSTLMKVLANELEPLAGTRTLAPDLRTGFLAQLELEQLDGGGSALSEFARRGGEEIAAWPQQKQRDHLGRFGFRGDRVFEPTRNFSGGERSRLALSILVARRPNLLLLDEPTNHLDLSMRHTLLMALQEFPGAVVIVSHDRSLLRGACDRFLLVAQGALAPFEGDLEDYASWLSTDRAGAAADVAPGLSRREQRRREAEARSARTPLRAEQENLERQIAQLARERADIEAQLADPQSFGGAAEQHRLAQRHRKLKVQLAGLEERWLTVTGELEERAS
ncbi:MAG: ATP-binding cassette domain-containing protein [Proteobacteria bacterium]|nr:ATP-binding cassette domain-containing protein [Pseudomonadota bacterium]